MNQEPYQEQLADLIARLESNPEQGLDSQQAAALLEKYGPNALKEKKKQTMLQKLLAQFKDVMVLILIAASLVSAFLGEYIDASVIIAIVLINAILGVVQEGRAKRRSKLEKDDLTPGSCSAGWRAKLIAAAELVRVTWCCSKLVISSRLICACWRASRSRLEEASLTGESVRSKKTQRLYCGKNISRRPDNMVFMSTAITTAKAVVWLSERVLVRKIGKIADKLQEINEEKTRYRKISTAG
jgi:Ca2+-transporting ATPase